jgi:hypothetical protein
MDKFKRHAATCFTDSIHRFANEKNIYSPIENDVCYWRANLKLSIQLFYGSKIWSKSSIFEKFPFLSEINFLPNFFFMIPRV